LTSLPPPLWSSSTRLKLRTYSAHLVRGASLTVLGVLAFASPGFAQRGTFVTGAVFADVKRFSRDTVSFSLPLDGTAFGAGGRVGVALTQQWTAELGIDAGQSTTNVRDLFTPTPVPRQTRTENQLIATSAVIGYHPQVTGRVVFGYFGGLTFMHAIRKTDTLVAGVPVESLARHTVDNVAAATIGMEARISLSKHLAVVPEVRASAFSLSGVGPSGFAIRPGVGMRWTF
jgi:hypothetical protein